MSEPSATSTAPALEQVFRRALDLSDEVDVTALAYGHHDQWDSVGHMVLVAEIEDAFGVMLDTDDVIGLSDWQAALELLERLGVS